MQRNRLGKNIAGGNSARAKAGGPGRGGIGKGQRRGRPGLGEGAEHDILETWWVSDRE